VYFSRYDCNYIQSNVLFKSGQARMGGSRRMGSDDDVQIRQVLPVGARFCFWARWPRVFTVKTMCYILIAILALSNSQRSWDKVDTQMMLLSYLTVLQSSQVPHISQGIAHV